MKFFAQIFFISLSIGASGAQAAPVAIFSELSLESTFVINSGNLIPGALVLGNQGILAINGGSNSAVDALDTNESVISNAQVGNPFTVPPLPFLSSRTDATSLQGSPLEGAQGSFDVATTQSADTNTGHVFNRTINTEGNASILFATDPINSSGLSFFDLSRQFSIENTSNAVVSFSIAGFFSAALSAEVIGEAGGARSLLDYSIFFEQVAGATVIFSEIIPFSEAIDDSAPGATVTQNFTANDSGLLFEAEAISDIENGGGLASAAGAGGYGFNVQLDPGVSFFMTEGWSQRNEVAIREQGPVTAVPLPATGLLLMAGLLGLWGMRRKHSA